MKKSNIKFDFATDFQLEILRYILQDKDGGLILNRLKPSYLVLIEHSLIAEAINKYFKAHNKIPSRNILKEVVKELLESKNYVNLVTKDDVPNIDKIINNLYSEPLRDHDYIQEKVYQFSTYVEMKNLNDSFDLTNFDQYEEYSRKIENILKRSKPKQDDEPLYLIKDLVERQFKRQSDPDVIPSPYRQLNELTNAGGYSRGSIIVLLDKPKARKTFFLVNVSRGYLRMKKSVLYIDTENGKNQIMDRVIQSSINKTKKEIYSGEFDKLESQHIRKLSRFGVEMIIDRVPAMVTDCNYIRDLIIKLRNQGINISVLIVDYAAKLASISRDKDDFERISNVYVDLQNLADDQGLDCVWTANHVTRDGSKHRETRYEETDIAKCVDIIRHAQCIFGLNATPQEERDNIQRLEIVVQRDGKPRGRALFHIDVDTQRATEFTKDQRKRYDEVYGNLLDNKLKVKKDNPDADSNKASKLHGDI